MREISLTIRQARLHQPVALTDNERVIGAAVLVDDDVALMVEVTHAETDQGAGASAAAALQNLDPEAIDARVQQLLDSPDYTGQTQGELYLAAILECVCGD
jgi:hypothetical protein